jgi:hypothetical protein
MLSSDFPLWRLRPEDAARIIILEPKRPVTHPKHWYKRTMRIKASPRSAPRAHDIQALRKAGYYDDAIRHGAHDYWKQYAEEYVKAYPVISIMQGPLLEDGAFFSQAGRAEHPLGFERQREPWLGMYSRVEFEYDCEIIEAARALIRENYILGQRGEGLYVDGLIYLKADKLCDAEIDRCKARLQTTRAILEKKAAGRAKPKANDQWRAIGTDEAVAKQWEHSGFKIRKIDRLTGGHYEVLMK